MFFFRLLSRVCGFFFCIASLFAGQPLTVTTELTLNDPSHTDLITTELVLQHELGAEHRFLIAGTGRVVTTAVSEDGIAVLGVFDGTLSTHDRARTSRGTDLFLVLLDRDGEVRAVRTFGGPEHDLAYDLWAEPDGWVLRMIEAGPVPEPLDLFLDDRGGVLDAEGETEIGFHQPIVDDTGEDETEDPEG